MFNLGRFSGKGAPNIRLTPTRLDRILELIAGLVWIGSWVLAIIAYMNHSMQDGQEWFLFPLVGTVALLLIGAMAYIPIRFINFPVRIHEGNAGIQYFYATRFARIMNIIVQLINITTVVYYSSAYYGFAEDKMRMLFLIHTVFLFAALIVYQRFARRYK